MPSLRGDQHRTRLAQLIDRLANRSKQQPGEMKFSHSLLFNAVPEWTNHYLAYDALKAQIYKFEKQAVQQQAQAQQSGGGPPTLYRDEETDVEAAAGAGQTTEEASKEANERVFTRLLDKELNKITEFYVEKERELLNDLVLLKEDLERLREEEEDLSPFSDADADHPHAVHHARGRGRRSSTSGRGSSAARATSGASDSEDEGEGGEGEDGEEGEDDGPMARRQKGAFERAFADPREYDAATRAGRKSGRGGVGPAGRRKSASSAAAGGGKRRLSRGMMSSASEANDLIGLEEADDDGDDGLADASAISAVGDANGGASADAAEPLFSPSSQQRRRQSYPSAAPALRARPSFGTRRGLSGGNKMGHSILSAHEAATEGENEAPGGVWDGLSDWAVDQRIMYKRRLAGVFTSLSELKQFVDLNYTGLSKVLKKFDKITSSSLRQPYMTTVVDRTFPFEPTTQTRLQDAIASIIPLYADLATGGDPDLALKQLKAHLREHVVWERNTVWREMIGLERRGWTGRRSGPNGTGTDLPLVQPASPPPGEAQAKARWINSQTVAGAVAVVLFFGILSAQWFDRVEEQNCLALLCFVTIFWALEIVPLFVTALLVPFLVVVLRVIRSTDGLDRRLSSVEATKYIFGQMFSPTIMLLLGGFTLAAALSKQNIDKVLATKVLSLAGTRPKSVLFAYMCVACFASMWISNVAAPVLCYSLIQPILRTLPSKAPFSKALILGIALASNIGGMASPISSPQNLIALEYMSPAISWLGWFAVSIPVAFSSVVLIWAILLWSYRAGGNGVVINPVRVNKEPFTRAQWFVSAVTMATIALWCVESRLSWLFGDMGIIAIIPIVSFYGSGILRKADFDHSPWSIVFLAMGGIGLGKAVLGSGLLDDIDAIIEHIVLGLDIWPILALFAGLVLVIATFISHTIAAVLVVPIAASIGSAMDTDHARLLIFATALVCSAGMGLPISGFPNLQAINVEDELGQRYLQPSDFFRCGIPASVVATAIVITMGYGVMRLMGL
ncbi:hypothetical protein JCM6882_003435 [Rhodosporidiobolus microsporus]